jgi:hypothetical protein
MTAREVLRRKYKPEQVRLRCVGESAPASGRFFYRGDSGLYRAMRGAFQAIAPPISDENFLDAFRSAGCYLVDLCPEPVDDLDAKSRRSLCRLSEPRLTRTIARLQPERIATLLRSIEGNVERAASRAGWEGTLIRLPYPGRWSGHRRVFVELLSPVITDLMS